MKGQLVLDPEEVSFHDKLAMAVDDALPWHDVTDGNDERIIVTHNFIVIQRVGDEPSFKDYFDG